MRGAGESLISTRLPVAAAYLRNDAIEGERPLSSRGVLLGTSQPNLTVWDLTTLTCMLPPFLNRFSLGEDMRLKSISPASIIWVLLHTILFLFGIIVFEVPAVGQWIGVPMAQALGGGLAATGAAGVFIYLYLRQADQLTRSITIFSEGGLTDIFAGRAARIRAEYDRRLGRFKELDVIGFGLSSFREDYKGDFERWAQNARVRVLLADPDFPSRNASVANIRDREEGSPDGKIVGDIDQFLKECRAITAKYPSFQIRLMRCIPSTNIFRIDREIFFGPYLMGRASRNSPTFICKEGGFLFSALRDHFEAIWSSNDFSRPIA